MLSTSASKTQVPVPPMPHSGVSTTGGGYQEQQQAAHPLVKSGGENNASNPIWNELQHLSSALGFPSDMFTPSEATPFSKGLPLTMYESPSGITIKVVSVPQYPPSSPPPPLPPPLPLT